LNRISADWRRIRAMTARAALMTMIGSL